MSRLSYVRSQKPFPWLFWGLAAGAAAGISVLIGKRNEVVALVTGDTDPPIFAVGQASGLTAAEEYIISRESGGNPLARNPTSTAFGIGQLLIANRRKYGAQLGIDPDTTYPSQQLELFRAHIAERYGTAQAAMEFWQSHNWY